MHLSSRKKSKVATSNNKQQGAVWVEFLVVASFVLISLFTLIPILAKITDIRHKTEQSAQYAVWERSVGYQAQEKVSDTLKDEARHRVLADGNALVFTGQSTENMETDKFHYFLDGRSNTQNYTSLLGSRVSTPDQALMLSVTNSKQPKIGLINGVFDASTLSLQTKVKALINPDGYYHSNAQIVVKNPSWISAFTSNTTIMNASKSLLVDGWGAGGVDHNKEQVRKLQPRGFDNIAIKGLLEGYRNTMKNVPVISGKVGDLDFDVINSDKLLDENHTMGKF